MLLAPLQCGPNVTADRGDTVSDTSQGPGWWIASDGKWYPPEQHPSYEPPAPPPPPSADPAPIGQIPHATAPLGQPPPAAPASTPPGWYREASDSALVRYWDGATWSAETRPAAGAQQAQTSSAVVASVPTSVVRQPQPPGSTGAPGKIRSPLAVILLTFITLGIYGIYWQYAMFKEMNDYSGQGIGGAIGLILAIFISIVNVFLMSSEVGNLYATENRPKPVQGTTGLWILIPLVGFIIWVVKVQGHLNEFWKAHGAVA
jgi:Domain of unknown function (DUF4234)/Protein of unknown function (DUF2510)